MILIYHGRLAIKHVLSYFLNILVAKKNSSEKLHQSSHIFPQKKVHLRNIPRILTRVGNKSRDFLILTLQFLLSTLNFIISPNSPNVPQLISQFS